tara:strand:+ start:792 stop:980 length:189 start_codon:yes stop_codon:yes gene_type:complete
MKFNIKRQVKFKSNKIPKVVSIGSIVFLNGFQGTVVKTKGSAVQVQTSTGKTVVNKNQLVFA